MASYCVRACLTLTFLSCVCVCEALELLRASTTSGHAASTPSVDCRCSTYPFVTQCSWPADNEAPPLRYVSSFSERHRQESPRPCTLRPPSSSSVMSGPSSEQLWRCPLPDLKLYTDYVINVTAVYPSGSSSQFISFMLEDIVKPDPPEGVSVSVVRGRTVLLQWFPPSSWKNLDIFPLKYHVQYQWEARGRSQSATMGPLDSTSVELKALISGRLYHFSVCAEELLGLGHCSDWSSTTNLTVPAVL